MKDQAKDLSVVMLLEAQDLVATDTSSNILDTAKFDSATLLVSVGALTGVDGSNYLTPILQESDSVADTGFAAVDAADIIGGFTKIDATSKDSVIQKAGYIGGKRYVRVKLDYTGTGITAGIVGVIGLLGNAGINPAATVAPISAT